MLLPPQQSFSLRLAAVVERQPQATALLASGRQVSYAQLWARASHIATLLRDRNLGAEPIVALPLGNSVAHVTAMLGAWLAGAAFVPVDPSWPRGRQAYVVNDCAAAVALLPSSHGSGDWLGVATVTMDDRERTAGPEPAQLHADQLAYVVYTSGSTGEPKGVAVEHRGIVNLLDAQIPLFGLSRRSRTLLLLSTCFDASISDIGTTLLAGATLCIEPADGEPLMQRVARLGITHLDLPPALLRITHPERAPTCLQTVIIGGEPCPPDAVRRWARQLRVVNIYGPTEATVCSSMCLCDAESWRRPLIGQPIANTRYRVVDGAGRDAPDDRAGELHIGGIGLARGYVGRPELQAERFHGDGESRWYRTGDLVVRHRGGDVEFIGRKDRQLKVRGMLLAPEEIEARLGEHPAVARAAVVLRPLRPDGMREVLAAYFVARPDQRPSHQALEEHLAASLPSWMLPQRYEQLDALPLTSSGKIELAALAAKPLSLKPRGRAPASERERAVAQAFQQVLGIGEIGVDDDFHALGGDSLAALELVIAAADDGLHLSPATVMSCRTVAAIALAVDGEGAADASRDIESRVSCSRLRRDVAFDADWRRRLDQAGARSAPAAADDPDEAILITGATGMLGRYLLVELLRLTSSRIWCAARARDDADATERVLAAVSRAATRLRPHDRARLQGIASDLTQPRLGLTPNRWRQLCEQVSAIYHCGARVHMLAPYPALREANVGGTCEMLRMQCEGRPKCLHHASSLAVLLSSDGRRDRLDETDELRHANHVYGGYAQSKWAAEQLLRTAAGAAGATAVYRFGLLCGGADGQAAPTDMLSDFIRGTALVGCVPDCASAELQVAVTPVEFAATAMARLSTSAAPPEPLRTFHVATGQATSLPALLEAMRRAGAAVDEVAGPTWRRRILRQLSDGGDRRALTAAYLALRRSLPDEGLDARDRTLDLFLASGSFVAMDQTRAALAASGLTYPNVDPKLLQRYARQALSP